MRNERSVAVWLLLSLAVSDKRRWNFVMSNLYNIYVVLSNSLNIHTVVICVGKCFALRPFRDNNKADLYSLNFVCPF